MIDNYHNGISCTGYEILQFLVSNPVGPSLLIGRSPAKALALPWFLLMSWMTALLLPSWRRKAVGLLVTCSKSDQGGSANFWTKSRLRGMSITTSMITLIVPKVERMFSLNPGHEITRVKVSF